MIVLSQETVGSGGAPVPEEVVVLLARDLPEGSKVLFLEKGDDVEKGIPQAGRYGLLTHLDDPWQEPFAWVRTVRRGDNRLFVARLAYGRRPVVVVVPDAEWLDSRLRLVLDLEAEEASPGG